MSIVGTVVLQGQVGRDARILNEAYVPRMAQELVEDGSFGLVQVEAFQVVKYY